MEVFFIRHGRTEANARALFAGGGLDVPVSEEGAADAGRVAKSEAFTAPIRAAFEAAGVAGRALDDEPRSVYVSPMTRAKQTASILFPRAEQEIVEDFREYRFGSFEGKTYEQLKDTDDYIAWKSGGADSRCPNGGDSVNSCTERVSRAFAGIAAKRAAAGDSRPIVIVAHGGAAMAFLHAYIDPEKPFFSWDTPNCGVWHFDCAFKNNAPSLTLIHSPPPEGDISIARYGIVHGDKTKRGGAALFGKIFFKIIVVVILALALAAAGYFGYKKLTRDKVERLRSIVTRELSYCAELAVTKVTYSEIVSIKRSALAGLAKSYSIVRYNAVIRMGIEDVTKSGVFVSPDANSVYVSLPALAVLGNDITGFEMFDESRNVFVPIKTQDIFEEIKKSQDETLARVLEAGLKKESEDYAKNLVTRILSAMGFENIVVTTGG